MSESSLPIKLPRKITPPHQPQQAGAIQEYVYQQVAGSGTTSLQQLLLAITLPTTPGSDLDIYQAAVDSGVAASHQQLLDGIQQIFAGVFLIPATPPANRLGESFNSGTSSSGTASTSSTSSSSG